MSCVRSQGWGPARAPGPPPPPPRLEGAPRSTALRGVKFPVHPEATPSLRASQTCPRSSHLQTRFSFWLCPEGQDCWQQGPCSASSLHPPMWPVTREGQAGEGRGQGVLYGVSLRWTSCGLEGVAGKRKVWGGPHGGEEPRPGGGALGGVSPTLPRPPPPDNQLGRQVLGEGCPAGL